MEVLNENKKWIEEDMSLFILNSALNSNIEVIFPIILKYVKLNTSLTSTYWQNLIELFLKNNCNHYAYEIIKICPMKVMF